MDRPEGAVTPEELEGLLDKHGKVRVYMVHPRGVWQYFVKEPANGLSPPKYRCISKDSGSYNLDWNGVCHGMKNWTGHYIFVNYWHYYAYLLHRNRGEQSE